MDKMSAFTDCGSESIVIRMPYELIAKILSVLPYEDCYKELRDRVAIAARRSNKLTEMLMEER